MSLPHPELKIVVASTRMGALSRLVEPMLPGSVDGDALLIPSTLQADDSSSASLQALLRQHGIPAAVMVPVSTRVRFATLLRLPALDSAWHVLPFDRRDVVLSRVSLPSSLVDAMHRIVVCDLDRVAASGPFVLDVMARFAHPRDRVRLLASGQRQRSVAEVNLASAPSLVIVLLSLAGIHLAALTSDPIAGELLALSLAELRLGEDVGFTGPWEDAVVQRATELELGVRYPGELDLIWENAGVDDGRLRQFRDHVALRLGLALAP